jgi:hypothetical protein
MKFILENIKIENNTNVVSRPIFALEEITQMYEEATKNLEKELKIPKDVLNSFMIKDELNPDFWENKELKPKIKTEIIKIAKDFFKGLELPTNIKMKDILFVGSLANYNWSKYSDVDIHIVVDFSEFKEDEEFIKKFFNTQKKLWNDKHDITIFGYDVEMYVQELKQKLEASAIYSVPTNKWIVKPEKTNFKLDKKLIKRKVEKIFKKLEDIRNDYENKEYQNVIDKIEIIKKYLKQMRKSGLEKGGEYSTENIIFKVLRRTDFIELLNNYKNKAYDQLVSLNEEQP